MSWQAVGVFVALLGVIATFTLNLRSQRLTRTGQSQDRELANNAASRSEAAARLTEEYTRRVVDALEAIAAQPAGGPAAGVAAVARQARWHLVVDSGDTYRLTNVGNASALQVEVTADNSLGLMWSQEPPAELHPDEALIFVAAITFGTTDTTITVRWIDEAEPGKPQVWRYPLPG